MPKPIKMMQVMENATAIPRIRQSHSPAFKERVSDLLRPLIVPFFFSFFKKIPPEKTHKTSVLLYSMGFFRQICQPYERLALRFF